MVDTLAHGLAALLVDSLVVLLALALEQDEDTFRDAVIAYLRDNRTEVIRMVMGSKTVDQTLGDGGDCRITDVVLTQIECLKMWLLVKLSVFKLGVSQVLTASSFPLNLKINKKKILNLTLKNILSILHFKTMITPTRP